MTRVEQIKARIAERRASMPYDIALRREGAKPRPRKPTTPRPKRRPKMRPATREEAEAAHIAALAAIDTIGGTASRYARAMLREIEETDDAVHAALAAIDVIRRTTWEYKRAMLREIEDAAFHASSLRTRE